jgi:hypothetical protein
MAAGNGTITEIRLEAEGLSGKIICPVGLRPAPGQYLAASSPDPGDALPVILFPSRVETLNGQLTISIAPPLPPGWTSGMQVALRGPLGRGFKLPSTARRVALASLDGHPLRLMPLMERALSQDAAVTLYASKPPAGLPEEVEVLQPDLLPEAPAWADFLALDVPIAGLGEVRDRLGLKVFQRPACQTQVLVLTAMPCSGLAECGICAVAMQHGWALACSDGPVFDFQQLEGS